MCCRFLLFPIPFQCVARPLALHPIFPLFVGVVEPCRNNSSLCCSFCREPSFHFGREDPDDVPSLEPPGPHSPSRASIFVKPEGSPLQLLYCPAIFPVHCPSRVPLSPSQLFSNKIGAAHVLTSLLGRGPSSWSAVCPCPSDDQSSWFFFGHIKLAPWGMIRDPSEMRIRSILTLPVRA